MWASRDSEGRTGKSEEEEGEDRARARKHAADLVRGGRVRLQSEQRPDHRIGRGHQQRRAVTRQFQRQSGRLPEGIDYPLSPLAQTAEEFRAHSFIVRRQKNRQRFRRSELAAGEEGHVHGVNRIAHLRP